MPDLILGSTSPYRRALLEKLRLPFITASPDIDETPRGGESARQLVQRLAEAKAHAVAASYPSALIIGSDQVACVDQHIVGKPADRSAAISQLESASGRAVQFLTGLCLLNSESGRTQSVVEPFTVNFRPLSRSEIERYLDIEAPFNCAGSFKSEGYGITLFASLHGDDPNALIGLPLIQLVRMLAAEGVRLP